MGTLAAKIAGLVVLTSLGVSARLPDADIAIGQLASRFEFESTTIDNVLGIVPRQTRDVHPALAHIQPWIASVGAAAALGDIDGNLKPDDVCHVDTRTNRAIVAPVVGDRFAPFALIAPGDNPTIAPMGCLIGDLNEDGLPDLLVYYWGRPPVAFLRIDTGAPSPAARPGPADYRPVKIAGDQRWFSNAALLSDVDGDGHLDIVVGNYFCDDGRILDSRATEPVCSHPVMQDSMSRAYNGGANRVLLWAEAQGGATPGVLFQDVSGVFPEQVARGWTLAIGAQDLTGDAMPDLYFANDFGPDRLMVNCSHRTPAARADLGCFPVQGRVSFRLMEAPRGFSKPRSKVLGRDSFKGMGVEFADLNGDGIPDIYVSNITEKWALQESQFLFLSDGRKIDDRLIKAGIAPWSDESEKLGLSRSGWAWDAKLADFDNDGQLEALQAVGFVRGRQAGAGLAWRKSCWALLQELATANDALLKHANSWFSMEQDEHGLGCDLSGSNRNPFFVRTASGRYTDVSPSLAHIDHGIVAPTRGLAIADVDLDGRLDYAEAKQYAPLSFHLNRSAAAQRNAFIGLSPRFLIVRGRAPEAVAIVDPSTLAGLRSRPAIGVAVRITLQDGRTFVQQVDGGNGHSGKRSPDIHIGLGPKEAAGSSADVELTWRSADAAVRTERLKVRIDQHHAVLLPR